MVAKLLGGKRTGCNGESRIDVEHDHLAIEVKQRKALPTYLREGMDQAVREAGELDCPIYGKLPVVVLHQKGTEYLESYVCIRMKDFREWYVN